MPPPGATALPAEPLDLFLRFVLAEGALIGVIVILCIGVWKLEAMVRNGCPHCAHCSARKREEAARRAEERRLSDEYARKHGLAPFDDDDDRDPPPSVRA